MTEPEQPLRELRQRRSWSMFVVGGIVGLIVGAGVVALVFTLERSDPPTNTDGDVATACSLVRRTGSMVAEDAPYDTVQYTRWTAATTLVMTAGDKDSRYKPLGDAMQRSLQYVQFKMTAKGPEFDGMVADVRRLCDPY